MSTRTLKLTVPAMRGDDVRDWQHEIVQQFAAWKIDVPLEIDGVYGERTRAWGRSLLHNNGMATRLLDRGATPDLRTKVRTKTRTVTETARFLARKSNRAALRRKHPLRVQSGPNRALSWARGYLGKTENPPGSNRGSWGLTAWQTALGSWLVGQAWCGTFVGTALIRAGVKGINSRCAGVVLILDDALNGRNGWRSCVYRRSTRHGSVTDGRPGDAIGLFGEGAHVALIEKRVLGGYQTLEGNTSPGNGGSQANGGGVYRRTRPDSAVVYIARPRY